MIRPLRDLIVIKPCSPVGMVDMLYVTNITKSAANQTFHYAKVLAHGPKVVLAFEGTTVLVSEFAGEEIQLDGEKVWTVRERDIIGVVDESSLLDSLSRFKVS